MDPAFIFQGETELLVELNFNCLDDFCLTAASRLVPELCDFKKIVVKFVPDIKPIELYTDFLSNNFNWFGFFNDLSILTYEGFVDSKFYFNYIGHTEALANHVINE